MRPVSILTALLVSAALYAIVLDRERLLDWARAIAPAQAEAPAAAAQAEAVPDVPEDGTVDVLKKRLVTYRTSIMQKHSVVKKEETATKKEVKEIKVCDRERKTKSRKIT